LQRKVRYPRPLVLYTPRKESILRPLNWLAPYSLVRTPTTATREPEIIARAGVARCLRMCEPTQNLPQRLDRADVVMAVGVGAAEYIEAPNGSNPDG